MTRLICVSLFEFCLLSLGDALYLFNLDLPSSFLYQFKIAASLIKCSLWCVCVCVCVYFTSWRARARDTCPSDPCGVQDAKGVGP
jgi:hypothetical protein